MTFLRGNIDWLRNVIAVLRGIFFSFAFIELLVKALAITGITPLGEIIVAIGNSHSGTGEPQANVFNLYDKAMFVLAFAVIPIDSFLTGAITGILIKSHRVLGSSIAICPLVLGLLMASSFSISAIALSIGYVCVSILGQIVTMKMRRY